MRYTSKALGLGSFEEIIARDTFGLGLVVLESRSGKRPWGNLTTQELSAKGNILFSYSYETDVLVILISHSVCLACFMLNA